MSESSRAVFPRRICALESTSLHIHTHEHTNKHTYGNWKPPTKHSGSMSTTYDSFCSCEASRC
jgi:hypothetical protein